MSNNIKEFTVGKYRVEINVDEDPENPRDWDNVGKMVTWHGRYDLGDEQPKEDAHDYLLELARQAVDSNYPEALLLANRNKILETHYYMLPLSLYDHSGITMYIAGTVAGESVGDPRGHSPFDGAGWDSGQVGFIYVSLKKALEEAPTRGSLKGWDTLVEWPEGGTVRDYAHKMLTTEVETYDTYLTGGVMEYVIYGPDGEHLGSCSGFYEDETVEAEARDEAKALGEQLGQLEEATTLAEVYP